MTKKLRVAIDKTVHVFPAFSSAHPQRGHVVTLMFWKKTGAWATSDDEIVIDADCRTFWDKDEPACIAQLRNFVKANWQTTATITVA